MIICVRNSPAHGRLITLDMIMVSQRLRRFNLERNIYHKMSPLILIIISDVLFFNFLQCLVNVYFFLLFCMYHQVTF